MKLACIPAFNVEKTIGGIVKECLLHVDEVLVCDDGSTDNTSGIAEANGALVIRHQKNYGYGAALITLFDKAREKNADVVITIDGDGQDIPEFIPRLIAPLSYEGTDIVIGSRFLNGDAPPGYGKRGIKIIAAATNFGSDIRITDVQSGFRAFSKRAIQAIHPTEYGIAANAEVIAKAANKGLKVVEIPVVISYDATDSRTPKVPKTVKIFMNLVKHLSLKHPILSYGLPGLALVIVGAILGLQFLDAYLGRNVIYAGTLLGSTVTFITGVVLMATSVILYSMANMMNYKN
jgi:glycosyltransferase involved in cell wall biosynthesis